MIPAQHRGALPPAAAVARLSVAPGAPPTSSLTSRCPCAWAALPRRDSATGALDLKALPCIRQELQDGQIISNHLQQVHVAHPGRHSHGRQAQRQQPQAQAPALMQAALQPPQQQQEQREQQRRAMPQYQAPAAGLVQPPPDPRLASMRPQRQQVHAARPEQPVAQQPQPLQQGEPQFAGPVAAAPPALPLQPAPQRSEAAGQAPPQARVPDQQQQQQQQQQQPGGPYQTAAPLLSDMSSGPGRSVSSSMRSGSKAAGGSAQGAAPVVQQQQQQAGLEPGGRPSWKQAELPDYLWDSSDEGSKEEGEQAQQAQQAQQAHVQAQQAQQAHVQAQQQARQEARQEAQQQQQQQA